MDDIKPNVEVEEVGYSYSDLHKPDVEEKEEVQAPEDTEVEKEEELDPKALAEQVAKETADKVILAQQEAEKARLEAEEDRLKEEAKKNYDPAKEYLDKAKAEGKEPTWEDAFREIEKNATERALQALEDKQRLAEEQRSKAEAETKRIEEEQIKKYNDVVDMQLKELYDDGKLTAIKDKDNPNDQGVLERKALFTAMQETNNKRIAEGKPPVYSIKEVYAFHYKRPSAQPAGADAPVTMGKGNSSPNDNEEIDYRELKRPWSFFGKR